MSRNVFATRQRTEVYTCPANYHNGAAGFSFTDGHAVIHTWAGFKIKHAPVYYGLGGNLQLNVPAEDSWIGVRWMAENTTVKK